MPKIQCCLCPSWYTKGKLKYRVPELPDDTLGKLYTVQPQSDLRTLVRNAT